MYYRSIFCSYLLTSFVSCLSLVQAYQFHIADQIAHQLMQPLDSTSASGLHWIVRWQTNYTNWVKSFCPNYTWYHDISMTSPWPLLGSLTNFFGSASSVTRTERNSALQVRRLWQRPSISDRRSISEQLPFMALSLLENCTGTIGSFVNLGNLAL